jgi:hypothetical protein
VALVAVSVFTMATLTGCAAGFEAETNKVDEPGEGSNGTVGDVKIRGALLADVEEEPGSGVLVMGVVNDGAEVDALTEVRVADSEPADLGSNVSLPPRQLVQFGTNEVSPGAVYGGTYVLDGPVDRLTSGSFVPVSFTFRNAGSVTLDLLVLPATGDLASVTPTPAPTTPAAPVATTGPEATEASPEEASPQPTTS